LLYVIAAPFLRALLYGVTPSDPLTLGAATLALVATASLASWIRRDELPGSTPRRRCARIRKSFRFGIVIQ
jgi:hypothetical protein